eukprot:651264-Rhodomonas_salina.2
MDAVRDERGKPTGEFTDKMKDLIREHNLNMELPAEAEKFLPVARRHNLTMREICNRYARQNMARASKEDPKRIPGPYAHLRDDDPMFELLEWCLDINPATRATAAKALEHPWFQRTVVPGRGRGRGWIVITDDGQLGLLWASACTCAKAPAKLRRWGDWISI